MEQLTLEQAAKSYIDGYVNSGPPVHDSYFDALDKSFKAGAEWQKEQYNPLLNIVKEVLSCLANANGREYERKLLQTAINILSDKSLQD